MLIFKCRFICQSPRGCLSSLLNHLIKPFDETHAHVKIAPLSLETKLNNKQVESIHGKSMRRKLYKLLGALSELLSFLQRATCNLTDSASFTVSLKK